MIKYMVVSDLSDTFDYVFAHKLEFGEMNSENSEYTVTDSTLLFEFHPDTQSSDIGSLTGAHIHRSIVDKLLDEDGMKSEVNRVMNQRRSVYMDKLKKAQHNLDELVTHYTIGA